MNAQMMTSGAPVVRVATCSLNQHALDFDGNCKRILESIFRSKRQGARYRLGPELEICGYGCQDHFLEADVYNHSWACLNKILQHPDATCGILCDIGMPVLHRGVRYNCRIFLLDRRVVLIRPKLYLANDGNYRENRYFTPWHLDRKNEEHQLPLSTVLSTADGSQKKCPFGFFGVETLDGISIASESCEELFTPCSPHIALALDGIDIISNGSGSHHELTKLSTRVELMQSGTRKSGGVYMYANQQGCDGGRLYYDGCSMVFVNGDIVAQGTQFSVADIEVIIADVDIEAVRSYRGAISSRCSQAASSIAIPRVKAEFMLSGVTYINAQQQRVFFVPPPSPAMMHGPRYHTKEEEICLGPACWLWDYLRRSGASGFFLPLSGGADSASTCALVGIMCELVFQAVSGENPDEVVISDLRRIMGHTPERAEALRSELAQIQAQLVTEMSAAEVSPARPSSNSLSNISSDCQDMLKFRLSKVQSRLAAIDLAYIPKSAKEICRCVLHTAYLGTSNSSDETRVRANQIASQIGTFHMDCEIDDIVSGFLKAYESTVRTLESTIQGGLPQDIMPKFKSKGGHWMEDLALQNIQAR